MAEIVNFLSKVFVPEIVTLIVACLPVSELRGSIPLALGVFHFSIGKAYLLSIIGNFLPVVPLLFFLEAGSSWLMKKSNWAGTFFQWLFERTRTRSKVVQKYGAIGLTIFVAIPLPMTGAWTGCVAAFIFGINRMLAVLSVATGILLAGSIVTLSTLGLISLF